MIDVMSDPTQDAFVTQFSVDGQLCFVVAEGAAKPAPDVRIVGSVTLGKRRYAICANQPDTYAAPTDLLTARELQIAVLVAQGFHGSAIGRRLGISSFTVSTHLRRIYSKLAIRSRAALAARLAGTVALHRRPANPTAVVDQAPL
jgi:DNA-binding CsgD family transcriptional regulator